MLNSITGGKTVTYTGERVKMLNYKTLTEKDILQITVSSRYTLRTIQGENYTNVRNTIFNLFLKLGKVLYK